ncbi:hypothetical protein GFL21_17855 [Rhizobium anhuiense]|uniref:hypothetical protein n=1 Tax=Rhizobium anhuiense TaxID=1184720 RepID=UPI001440FEF8|nr:hypothetical protein [Rhizobium anhuiense]NKM56360.1 hypothetical protein [Rhizobium anhuiense]
MQIVGELIWKGRAWPAAEIASRTGDDFVFKTSGHGRPIELAGPAAWWRNFSELDLDDPDAVVGFVKRRGDPSGILSPSAQSDSSSWFDIAAPLKLAATCWTRNRGESACVPQVGFMEALASSREFRERINYVPYVWDGAFSVRLNAETLAAFMITSAILHLHSRVDMAVCQHCGDWFELKRRGSMYCSPSCRAAASTEAKKGRNNHG